MVFVPIDIREADLRVLSLCRPCPIIFPVLRSLRWRGGDGNQALSVSLFFGPAFEELWVYNFPREEDGVIFALEVVANSGIQLKELHLEDTGGSIAIGDVFSQAIRNMKDLVRLLINDCLLTDEATVHLAKLPKLQLFSCRMTSDADMSTMLKGSERHFPSLVTLEVRPENLPLSLITLLQYSHTPYFNVLRLYTEQQPLAFALRKLFTAVALHPCLREIKVWHLMGAQKQSSAFLIRDSIIRPLLQLLKIRVVEMSHLPFDLQDSSIADIAEAWSHAQKLHLGYKSGRRLSRVALPALLPLAGSNEPTSLGLVLDTSNVSDEDVKELEVHAGGALDRLDVPARSAIGDTKMVSKIFPNANIDGHDMEIHRRGLQEGTCGDQFGHERSYRVRFISEIVVNME